MSRKPPIRLAIARLSRELPSDQSIGVDFQSLQRDLGCSKRKQG